MDFIANESITLRMPGTARCRLFFEKTTDMLPFIQWSATFFASLKRPLQRALAMRKNQSTQGAGEWHDLSIVSENNLINNKLYKRTTTL
jgi:hypothetical protein